MNVVPLHEVVHINPRGESVDADEDVSFVGMAQLDSAAAIAVPLETRRFEEVSKGYTVFRDGDLLAAKITPCWENGKIGQAVLDHSIGVGSTEFHVLRPGGKVHDRYLLHFLRRREVEAKGTLRMIGSGGQRRVPVDYLANLLLPLPSLDEQIRVATILDRAEAITGLNRNILAKFAELASSFLRGMIDRSVGQVDFGSIISEGPSNGIYVPSARYGAGTPILRIDGFDSQGNLNSKPWKLVGISETDRERFELRAGDVVINRVNALSHLGKSVMIDETADGSVFESNMMRIRVDEERANPCFVAYWLNSNSAKVQVLGRAKKSINQASINQNDVRKLAFPDICKAKQDEFAGMVDVIRQEKLKVDRRSAQLEELMGAIRSQAFRGEL
ncbi:hypothetical protein FK529_16225 [Tsukamurella asaccharolytica]|uniref:Type I restriction modification DNA specificity domain-containing protein n=1 Tax=Tsukamurella asaccharolytica TaxID=2592067 RepID=A0A5C5R623_9ACTN|nr:restriction endonuclease subunit S [Tsukamurella asaccharolytica]TWS18248.1 hypothetical protein FK529_16225 [Tsukamurella asaccharolytica]